MRFLTLCLLLVAIAGLSSCAPTNPAAPASTITNQRSVIRNGTILSLRKIVVPAGSESWRKLLVDSGDMQPAGDSKAATRTEFIVRTDDGATLSIVQANALGLRPGERVVILRDTGARLARPDAAEQRHDNNVTRVLAPWPATSDRLSPRLS